MPDVNLKVLMYNGSYALLYGSAEALAKGAVPGHDKTSMKPLPAPHVPGNTESERMDTAVRKIFSVSKQEVNQREREWKQARKPKKATKR